MSNYWLRQIEIDEAYALWDEIHSCSVQEKMKPIFIAEIKTQSPFGYCSPHSFVELMEVAIEHGDWISVHTNALWGGDFDAISFVRRNTDKPILAKGLHGSDDDIARAIQHGATYALVVDRLPHGAFWENSLIEGFQAGVLEMEKEHKSLSEGQRRFVSGCPNLWDCKFVCNSRDLRTGKMKSDGLQSFLDLNVWTCQASGIRTPADVNPKVSAFIVGEHLMNFVKHFDLPNGF